MMKTLPREMTSISVEALFLGGRERGIGYADPLRSRGAVVNK